MYIFISYNFLVPGRKGSSWIISSMAFSSVKVVKGHQRWPQMSKQTMLDEFYLVTKPDKFCNGIQMQNNL